MSEQDRIHIAIIGAGLVGLTFAVALNALDTEKKFAIDLYEAAPELSEIGAGINLWPRTWRILEKIGMKDVLIPLLDHHPDMERRVVFEVRKADQTNGFEVTNVMKEGGVMRIHRADFQRTLVECLPLSGSDMKINSICNFHLSHRLIDYTEASTPSESAEPYSPPITLHFADRASATCDILIGADGIKSTARSLFLKRLPNPLQYERYMDPVWSGLVAYRGLAGQEELRKVFPNHRIFDHPGIMYIGKNKHVVVYPISGGKHINVVGAVDLSKDNTVWRGSPNVAVDQAEFFGHFEGWEEEVQALISCIERPMKSPINHLDHLDIFAKGRVFLMGDAVHAMVPHQGAGAGTGIEDAYALASLLTHSSNHQLFSNLWINQVADIYNRVRVPHAIAMSKDSIRQGHLCTLQTSGFEAFQEGDDVPRVMLEESFSVVEKSWSWTNTDPETERAIALDYLDKQVATMS